MTKAKRSSRSASRRPRQSARSASPTPDRPLITTVIFDLDDTLYDCFGQRVSAAHFRAAEAMASAGLPAPAEEIFQVRMQAFADDPQLTRIDEHVCEHFAVPSAARDRLVRAARLAFFTLPVGKLTLFPGTLPVLRGLKERGVRIFLVSFGDPEIQHDKVAALGLDREPSIDRVFYADTAHLVTKEAIFRSILRKAESDPQRVLVVGDRPSSEIRAGKSLGMHTVRLWGGEFSSLKPQGPDEQADFEISKIDAVLKLPFNFGKS
ncbi:MAG: HAD family hydrolase [Terriglobales bacterium]